MCHESKAEHTRSFSWVALVIVLAGFSLRIHQLGRDSFWNDEAGQALAAIQPTISGMLEMTRTHAMAMPLDYFVARAASLVSTKEFMLRFPAAIWGTLALASFFVLARHLAGPQVSSLAVLILALSPTHLRYSQELRFYAALCFFYLLSNIALYKALRQGHTLNWGIYVLVTFVGSYFHPYVLLSIFNGFCSLLFLRVPTSQIFRMSAILIACGVILGLLFMPGYEYFGAHQTFHYELLQWAGTLQNGIFQGMGWLAFRYTETTPRVGAWEMLNAVFAGLGILSISVHYKKYSMLLGWVLGTMFQILLIILADAVKGYWFSFRQLTHLAPMAMILVAIGAVNLHVLLYRLRFPWERNRLTKLLRHCLFPAIVCVFCLTATPRIVDYYHYQRSTAKEVVSQLLLLHKSGEPILIIPGYEEKIYRFYFIQARSEGLIKDLMPTSWQELPAIISTGIGKFYLATSAKLLDEQRTVLENLGFVELSGVDKPWYDMHALFVVDVHLTKQEY